MNQLCTMSGIHRVHQQLLHLEREGGESYRFEIEDKDTARVYVQGPNGTPYASGTFLITLTNLEAFPRYPPIVFFQTHIWHPLVEVHTGRVCPAMITADWSPHEGMEGFLDRLTRFFSVASVDTPLNTEAAAELQQKDGSFELHAVTLTQTYARG